MQSSTLKIKEFIQPFERHLALRELRALSKQSLLPLDGDWQSANTFGIGEGLSDIGVLRRSLAYWVSVGDVPEGLTDQIRREATSLLARNGASPDELTNLARSQVQRSLPRSRCLRYATHGIHEYRGKFFPQLVRALMNIAELKSDSLVLDPMCGSGTTLVEACLSERPCLGFDLNPLSVFLSDVKCAALTLEADQLVEAYQLLERSLSQPSRGKFHTRARFNASDQAYLARWFDRQVLGEAERVKCAIHSLENSIIRNFYLVSLSNILRSVSFQKLDDLRVRRELTEHEEGVTVKAFLAEALRATKIVAAHLADQGPIIEGMYSVQQADARRLAEMVPGLAGQVDAIITSPPYATALPYIDTDRLSLIYLGLLPRADHRALESEMIGNREISVNTRKRYWETYTSQKDALPQRTCDTIDLIDELNRNSDAGFRRLNLAALLSKYFLDMRQTLRQLHVLLKPKGVAFLVVGNNSTIAGGQAVHIDTCEYLCDISQSVGFSVEESISMEMLASRDIFRKNAMRSERILELRKTLPRNIQRSFSSSSPFDCIAPDRRRIDLCQAE